MSVTRDIVATYRRPHQVFASILSAGTREDRALAYLMAACLVIFVAQWPRLARQAHLTQQELNPMLGGALLGWLFIAPLAFYVLALLTHIVLRLLRRNSTGFSTRIALFWALLASSPLLLLYGMVGGFIGAGAALSAVGLIWICCFFWFWVAGLLQASKGITA